MLHLQSEGYYVSPDMGLMLISVDCILCLKAGKCADEGSTINEPYHLMASLPPSPRLSWLTEKAPAKCHRQTQCTCEIMRETNDPQMDWSLIIAADSNSGVSWIYTVRDFKYHLYFKEHVD